MIMHSPLNTDLLQCKLKFIVLKTFTHWSLKFLCLLKFETFEIKNFKFISIAIIKNKTNTWFRLHVNIQSSVSTIPEHFSAIL